ncbi:MAG: hypothetical protein ABS84_17210 [Rubrivivax sp. SCN 71-131]|nr:MAG: hypothetical protein ABS84_17210 [Rubrivivax sp. SCN 71-131]
MRPEPGVTRLRHVGIVGAGLAGLAAAVAAAAAGVHVEVFDAAPDVAAPPAQIDVVPNLVRDLSALGLAEACVRRGFAYRGVSVVDAYGRAHFEIETPALGGARLPAAIGMPYAELLRVLRDSALARGAVVHWQCTVCGVEAPAARPHIALADGRRHRFDLVVMAGAADVAGIELPLHAGGERLPQRWDYVLLPRPQGLDQVTWVVGPGRTKAMIVPVSMREAGLALLRDERMAGAPAAGTPAQLRAALAVEGDLLARLGESLRDDATVVGRPVRSGLLAGAWHVGAVLRLGSSAHVLPPHFGQAAAQSVEDAAVLGDLLRADLERDELLARFGARRATRAARVHALVSQAARWDLDPEPATDLAALARRLAPIVAHGA